MRVISKKAINAFIEIHPNSTDPMLRWYILTKEATWANFGELKSTFPASDAVGNGLYIFDVGGNKYRIIARVIFPASLVYIRFVGTHQQYDKVDLSEL